ncbi:MAG: AAA family ATPase [Planctomycetes bacterium]|nr:AAA family ATPase [Planctomycetota bacterium]
MTRHHKVDDIDLVLSIPVAKKAQWIGQEEVLTQLQACWHVVHKDDLPLTPRIIGKPGMGKTTLAQAAANLMKKDVYIFQCTMDTRPEDLIVTPVLSDKGKIIYHASPLMSAAITGGACILDEANRMSEKSWASLAPLLDHRRYAESIVAGIKIEAHPDFRCCVTMNDDSSTYEVPDYILSRLSPMISMEFPEREEEIAILRYNIGFAPDKLLQMTVDFLQSSHAGGSDYSVRDGISIIRYTLKLRDTLKKQPLDDLFKRATKQILGDDAFEPKKRDRLKNTDDGYAGLSFEDFFMNQFFVAPSDEVDPERKPGKKKKPPPEEFEDEFDDEETDD